LTFLILLFGSPLVGRAQTDFSLGDAANFAVLYEGDGKQLQFNNSMVTGNIGIGSMNGTTGQFQGNGPGTITGTVEFNNSSGAFSNSGLTITGNSGNPLYSQTNINSDLTTLNSLSRSLGLETGTSTTITTGGSVNVSSGTLDLSGNRVFTVTSVSFPNGTFTINGSATDYVVFNYTGNNGFNGNILLTGGITSDHVLFNITPSSSVLATYNNDYANLTGGPTLTISTNGLVTTGVFLDPTGNIQINHTVLDGRLFGGDTQNLAIVSGAEILAPGVTPEPSSILLFGTGLLGLGGILRRRLLA
jgi:PEP-CTERM motif